MLILEVRRSPFGYYSIGNIVYSLFSFYVTIVILFSVFLISKSLKTSQEQNRKALFLLIFGSSLALIGGINDFLPIVGIYYYPLTGVYVYPFGSLAIGVYGVCVAYSIIRHQLMDIEVIIKRTLVFAGLFGSVFLLFSAVSLVSQNIVSKYVHVSTTTTAMATMLIMLFAYEPIKNWLVNATNKFLFQKKVNYRDVLRQFSQTLINMIELHDLSKEMVKNFTQVMALENARLFLFDEKKKSYLLAAEEGMSDLAEPLSLEDPVVKYLREKKEMLYKTMLLERKENQPLTDEMNKLKAQLVLPLVFGEDVMGFLTLGKKKSDEDFTSEDLDMLISLEAQISVAIHNAVLFNTQKEAHALLAQKNKMDAVIALASGINHEINNPLSIITMKSQNFLRKFQQNKFENEKQMIESAQEVIDAALRNANRAHAITKRIGRFAKPVKDEAVLEALSLNDIINDAISLIGNSQFHDDNITVEVNVPQDCPAIYGDQAYVSQIFFNLINNARHAIEKDGKITVVARPSSKRFVDVDITDTGSGIKPENMEKIWDPFFTTKPTVATPGSKITGTGLGLPLVKRYMEAIGGLIHLQSEVGKGTTFTLSFIKAEGAATTPSTVPVPPSESARAQA